MQRRSFLKLLSAVPFASVLAWPKVEEDPPAFEGIDPEAPAGWHAQTAAYRGTALEQFNDFAKGTSPVYISRSRDFMDANALHRFVS